MEERLFNDNRNFSDLNSNSQIRAKADGIIESFYHKDIVRTGTEFNSGVGAIADAVEYNSQAFQRDVQSVGYVELTEGPRTKRSTDSGYDLLFARITGSPEYHFFGTMSEEMLHRYMARSLEMGGVSTYKKVLLPMAWANGGTPALAVLDAHHTAEIDMVIRLGAKFVGGMVSFWGYFDIPTFTSCLNQFKEDVERIHSNDSDVICEGRVWEYVDGGAEQHVIPAYVWRDFGLTPPTISIFFRLEQIVHTPGHCCDPEDERTPPGLPDKIDITKQQAQMWVYYLATQMIAHGAESIHFGDVYKTGCWDRGNAAIWKVVSLVRDFAAGRNLSNASHVPNARRGLVLCNATYFKPEGVVKENIYYSPDRDPSAPWEKRLIFDFHYENIRDYVVRASTPFCTNDFLPIKLNPSSPYWWRATQGGLHPLGWLCTHNVCVTTNDNTGVKNDAGCGTTESWNPFWGYDWATWFLAQSSAWKDKIIPYLYFGIKCLNPYTHRMMPGRIISHTPTMPSTGERPYSIYTANDFGQDVVIANTWNDAPPIPATPYGWVFHDFMVENVAHADNISPNSSLIRVGNDKMYYIGNDGYIHGYIKVNGDYNEGVWLSVSPSYACSNLSIAGQVKAANSLVASPDGARLLYIGVDGYIYGFDLRGPWTYEYITERGNHTGGLIRKGFMTNSLRAQNIVAVGSLIYATNESIYYVGKWLVNGALNVQGFQKSSPLWSTISPSFSAASSWATPTPVPVSSQAAPAASHALVYEPRTKLLYYKTAYGLLAYFEVNPDLISYTYKNLPNPVSNWLTGRGIQIQGNLAAHHNIVTGETRLYFAGNAYDIIRPYCFAHHVSGIWNNVNLSDSAQIRWLQPLSSQLQCHGNGFIAVSPNGENIAYIANTLQVAYYRLFADGSYSFNMTEPAPAESLAGNSLQFISINDVYYISSGLHPAICRFTYQKNYCKNSAYSNFP